MLYNIKSSQQATRLTFNADIDIHWLQEHLPESFFKSLAQKGLLNEKFEWLVDITDSHLAVHRDNFTLIYDLNTQRTLLLYTQNKEYQEFQASKAIKKAENNLWSIQQSSKEGGRQKVYLNIPGTHMEVWISDELQFPKNICRAFYEHLFSGIPENLLEKLSQMGLPVEITIFLQNQSKKHLAHFHLVKSEKEILSDPLSTTPPQGFSPINPVEGANEQYHGPSYDSSKFKDLNTELQRKSRQMINRHTIRESGQSIAWIMQQPVLDRIRALLNTFIKGYDIFEGMGDGSISVDFDLWPILKQRLNRADFSSVPGIDNGSTLTATLELLVMLNIVRNRQTPVLDSVQPGGMTSEEATQYERQVNSEADLLQRMANYVGGSLENNIFRGRQNQMREAQLRFLLGPRFIARDDMGTPIRELRMRIPNDDHSALLHFVGTNFNIVVDINHQEIIDQLLFDEGLGRLQLHIPHIRLNLSWETYPASSTATTILSLLTFGAYMQWIFNVGSWNFGASHPRLGFNIFPVVEGRTIDRVVRLRVAPGIESLYNPAIIDWTADPVVSANPMTAELLGLWSQVVIDSFQWMDFFTTKLIILITSKLDEFLNAPPFRWPEIWKAKDGPQTFGLAALFGSGSGIWEGELLDLAYLVGRGVAVSVNPEIASSLGIVVSRRYLSAWLQQVIRNTLFETPSTQSLSVSEIEDAVGVQLPSPDNLVTDELPEDAERTLEQLRLQEILHCPDAPAPPPPVSEHIAVLTRSVPTIRFPEEGIKNYVAEFSMHFDFAVQAVRTWNIPVVRAEGSDCLPVEEIDRGFDFRFNPWTIGTLGFNTFFENLNLRQPFPNQMPFGFTPPKNGEGFFRGLPPFSSGGRTGIGPSGGGPRGRAGSRHCSHTCTWAWETRRRSIHTYLSMSADVTGKLIIDFDPLNGNEGVSGPLIGVLPVIRLSAVQIDGSLPPLPELEVAVTLNSVKSPWDRVDTTVFTDYFRRLCESHAQAIFSELTHSNAPLLRQTFLPPAAITLPSMFVPPAEYTPIPAVYEFIRNLLVYRQIVGAEMPPVYIVEGDLVYWPLDIEENLTGFLP